MNQDDEIDEGAIIHRIRQQVLAADCLWIFSPVYNHGMPGSLKNLLDWLSRSMDENDSRGASAVHQKTVTVSSAAASGYEDLFAEFSRLLPYIRMKVAGEFTHAPIGKEGFMSGVLSLSNETEEKIQNQAKVLL